MALLQHAVVLGRAGLRRGRIKAILLILFIISCFLVSALSFAAETAKYQVVAGSDDKAYLVDTTTGQVWVLTYRTLATGREPIAIPYKFIKIAPKGYPESLIENVQGVSMPPGGKP